MKDRHVEPVFIHVWLEFSLYTLIKIQQILLVDCRDSKNRTLLSVPRVSCQPVHVLTIRLPTRKIRTHATEEGGGGIGERGYGIK